MRIKAPGGRRSQPEPALEGGRSDPARRERLFGRGAQMVRWLYLSGLVFAVLIPAGWQVAPKDLEDLARWKLFGSQNSQSFPSHAKRHSEGTFTSDFTRYLDRMKAKDFVHWLINTKRYN